MARQLDGVRPRRAIAGRASPSPDAAASRRIDRRRWIACLAAAAAAMAPWAAGAAQPFPARAVRIIVPFPPGGPSDVIARTVGQELAAALKQPVVVDNRAGAGGTTGTAAIARSAPDGYTIGLAAVVKRAIVAHPSAPFHDVRGLVAYAKANPGKLNYASSGVGTANHRVAELVQHMADIQLTHVPYKGTGPAAADLLAGMVPLLFESSLLSAAQTWGRLIRGKNITID